MLAVDTNIIVRYLTGDHPVQSALARNLVDGNDVFVCSTVLLEAEWVLRSVYGFAATDIVLAFLALLGLARVTPEAPRETRQALDWMRSGMDFADALHLTKAATCESFVSFDRELARSANRIGAIKVRAP